MFSNHFVLGGEFYVSQMFIHSVSYSAKCLANILFATFFATYAVDHIGATAGDVLHACKVLFCCMALDGSCFVQQGTIFSTGFVAKFETSIRVGGCGVIDGPCVWGSG